MEFKSPEEFFYKINQMFSWILAAPLIFFIVLFLEWRDTEWKALLESEETRIFFIYLLLPIVLAFAVGTVRSFIQKRRVITELTDLVEKLKEYASSFVRMQLFLAVTALIALTGLYLTGSNLFAAYYFIMLFYISINRPSPEVISKHLRLKKDERDILIKKKPFQNES